MAPIQAVHVIDVKPVLQEILEQHHVAPLLRHLEARFGPVLIIPGVLLGWRRDVHQTVHLALKGGEIVFEDTTLQFLWKLAEWEWLLAEPLSETGTIILCIDLQVCVFPIDCSPDRFKR